MTIALDDPFDDNYDKSDEYDALTRLLNYDFQGSEDLGTQVGRYNGARRVDVLKLSKNRIVRSPRKFLTVIEQLQRESRVKPSYGLEVKNGNKSQYVHFTLELNEENSVGVFYFDSNRILAVPQVHNVERLINKVGLSGAIIIANKIGIPAKQEAIRINDAEGGYGILTIEQYSSIEKRYLDVY